VVVEVASGSVVVLGCPGVGVAGEDLCVPQGYSGGESVGDGGVTQGRRSAVQGWRGEAADEAFNAVQIGVAAGDVPLDVSYVEIQGSDRFCRDDRHRGPRLAHDVLGVRRGHRHQANLGGAAEVRAAVNGGRCWRSWRRGTRVTSPRSRRSGHTPTSFFSRPVMLPVWLTLMKTW